MLMKSINVSRPTKPEEWDGDWRLIEYDPFTDISEWWLYRGDGSFTIRKIQHNVCDILDANQAELNSQLSSRWGEGKKVASIPLVVFESLGLDDALAAGDTAHMKRVLNDGDYAKLRTFKGNL